MPIVKIGEWLHTKPDYEDRVYNSGVGKERPLIQILSALGFRLEGEGNAARVSAPEHRGAAPAKEAKPMRPLRLG